jgi:hypothetical protein
VAVDRFDKLRTDLDTLLLLIVLQEFGNPPGRLLLKAQFVKKHGMNRKDGRPIDCCKSLNAQLVIIFKGGSDRGDDSRGPYGFFAVEMALVIGCFSLFILLMMA